MTDRQIEQRVRCGRWVRAARGVYRLAGAPITWQQHALAACMGGPAGTLTSHLTTAAVYSLPPPPPLLPHITVEPTSSARSPLARTHRSAVDPVDRASLHGIPVTSVARTIVDCAGLLHPPALDDLVDTAFCNRLATRESVEAALARIAPGTGRAGTGRLRASLEVWTPGPIPGSPAEMRAIRQLARWRLPVPVRQHPVYDDAGRLVGVIDIAWPWVLVGLEYDSGQWHGPRRADADERRQARLEALGWYIARAEKQHIRPTATGLRDELRAEIRARSVRLSTSQVDWRTNLAS